MSTKRPIRKRFAAILWRFSACCAVPCLAPVGAAEVLYVKADAGGVNDGSSWTDAFVDLQDALLAAADGDQVWVAAGRYVPRNVVDPNKPRLGTFSIPSGVMVYGGFAGEEATLENRAGLFEQTVLSGDVNGDDDPNFVNYDENVYHVVTFTETADGTLLDGFLVRGGNADAFRNPRGMRGAGALVEHGAAAVRYLTFAQNRVFVQGNINGGGPGAFVQHGALTLEYCSFRANQADARTAGRERGIVLGGAAGAESSDLVVRAGEFWANRLINLGETPLSGGGGIYCYNNDPNTHMNVLITGCVFEENLVQIAGGAAGGGAVAIECNDGVIDARLENSTLARNEVRSPDANRTARLFGGAVFVETAEWPFGSVGRVVRLAITDCEITGNRIINQNTDARWSSGGGISSCADEGSLQLSIRDTNVRDNTIMHTRAGQALGAGVAVTHNNTAGAVEIVNSRFTSNQLTALESPFVRGGGLLLSNKGASHRSPFRVVHCEVRGNSILDWRNVDTPIGHGGGLVMEGGAPLELHGALIAGNAARAVGGVSLASTQGARVSNATIAWNLSVEDVAGLRNTKSSTTLLRNALVWNNTSNAIDDTDAQIGGSVDRVAVDYSNVEGWQDQFPGLGNIDADPMFVDPLGPDGMAGTDDDDYRLTPGSPCIDAGWNNAVPPDWLDLDGDRDRLEFTPADFDGNPRFADDPKAPDSGCGAAVVVDMGVYEFQGTASQPCRGDIDGDGAITANDLMLVLERFGSTAGDSSWSCRADLIADSRINISDLGMLLAVYGDDCD